jgi:hypothetical protein
MNEWINEKAKRIVDLMWPLVFNLLISSYLHAEGTGTQGALVVRFRWLTEQPPGSALLTMSSAAESWGARWAVGT